MTAAQRKTPTPTNGGADDGVDYTNAVNAEIEALWQVAATELISIGGTASAITATSDTSLVAAITALERPMAFWLTPTSDWPGGAGTLTIDGNSAALKDQDGNDPTAGALKAARRSLISFDGTNLRIAGGASSTGGGTQDNAINGGRLTISTGVPVLSAAVSGATLVYWSPDASDQISLYNGSAWIVIPSAETSIKFTDAQTGNTHNGTKVIDGLTDTSKLMVGMKISGTDVGAGSTIASVDSSTQITGTVNSTGSASNTITFKVPADTGVDIFGKDSSSALLLQGLMRASMLTPNTMAKQDGIDVLGANATWRWLGTVISSATDGQIDWAISGQRRYRVWNRNNKHRLFNKEAFASSSTWYAIMGLVSAISEICGGGGSGGNSANTGGASGFNMGQPGAPGGYSLKRFAGASLTANQTVTIGSTSSFGANHSATSGANGANGSAATDVAGAAPGTGSSGDINITGGGMPGGSPGLSYAGDATNAGTAGGAPLIKIEELVEF